MMGRSHLLLGAAGFLAADAAAPGLLHAGPAQLLAGTLVCAGAAMLPDLDHPQATLARCLPPVSEFVANIVNKLAGGHRKGTHTIWAWLGVSLLAELALHSSHGPWIALGFSIFCALIMLRVLTESHGLVCLLLAGVLGGAAVLATGPGGGYAWLIGAVVIGYGLHLLGDIVTTEGLVPFYPLSKKHVGFPIIGTTDQWRERGTGALCGLVAFYLLLTMVFIPGWKAQAAASQAQHAALPTLVATPPTTVSGTAASQKPSALASEVQKLSHELSVLRAAAHAKS